MIWRTCFFRPGLRESWVYLGLRDSWVVTTVGPDEDFTRMSRLLRIDVIYGVIWWMFRCFTLKTTRLWLKCQDNPFSFEIFCPYLASVSDKLWFHDFSWLWISSDFSVFHFSLFDLVHWWFACFRCCRLLDRTSRDFTAISQAMGSVNSCETPVLTEAPVSKDKATWFNEACQTREHQFRNQRLYKNKLTVS